MSRCTLRNIFTVLIYAGVAIFLYPYVTGHLSNALIFLVTGIGLAVCRKITDRHGGSIVAKSAEGQGAAFIVTLPVTQTLPQANE